MWSNRLTSGTRYSEKQVNEILKRYHEDTATLRRELVGFGLMQREGGEGEYWRVAPRSSGRAVFLSPVVEACFIKSEYSFVSALSIAQHSARWC